jgi:hypothetical protein
MPLKRSRRLNFFRWGFKASSAFGLPLVERTDKVPRRILEVASTDSSDRGVQGFLDELGPGLITGAADDDPSGTATYSVVGASFGYATLWTALLLFP